MIAITDLWMELGGPEPRYNRARAFYRNGKNPGSVRFYPDTNSFYDFGACIGGHTVTLVALALGIPYQNARQWLKERFGGSMPYQPIDPDPDELSKAYAWRLAMLSWLQAQLAELKKELAEELAAGRVDKSVAGKIREATSYQQTIESLTQYQLIIEYRRQCAQHPDQVCELLAWAEDCEAMV